MAVLGGLLPFGNQFDFALRRSFSALMNDTDRERLLDLFDVSPATVEEFQQIVRTLVADVPCLSPLETEILEWDRDGRDADHLARLAIKVWAFSESGELAFRERLFAGFVTSQECLDGYGADYLIDFALAAGVPADTVLRVLRSRGTC